MRRTMRAVLATAAALIISTALAPAPSSAAGNPHAPSETYREYRNWATGMCLGTDNGRTDNGTPIIVWDCNGNPDQQWSAIPQDNDVYYRLHNLANPSKCLGIWQASGEAGAPLTLWDCNSNPDQFWTAWGYGNQIVLINHQTNQVMAMLNGDTARGTPVIQWLWNGNVDQRWY